MIIWWHRAKLAFAWLCDKGCGPTSIEIEFQSLDFSRSKKILNHWDA
jgi:hypothetical protein